MQRKAARRSFETRNWAIHAPEDDNQVDMHEIIHKYLYRPFMMMVLEPILILVPSYMALIYGTIHVFDESYHFAFQEGRGWNAGVGALPFHGITLGVIVRVAIIIYASHTRFKRKMRKLVGSQYQNRD